MRRSSHQTPADRLTLRCRVSLAAAVVAAFLVAGTARPASAARFEFPANEKSNSIQFVSRAPAETVTGKTNQLSGHVVLDPSAVGDSIEISIDVPLTTLDTGMALRNQHMRENHLETDKFPTATFRGAHVVKGAGTVLAAGQTQSVEIEGEFQVHGVTKTIHVPVELTWTPASGDKHESLRSVARFDVKLSEYDIKRPQFLVMKLDEVQHVTFDVTAYAAP